MVGAEERRAAGAGEGKARAGGELAEAGARPDAGPLDTFAFAGRNFPGINQTEIGSTTPPDTTGAIGLTHYFEMTNGKVAVFNRALSGGQLSSSQLNDFAGFPVDFVADPQVLWDPTTSRFYAVTAERRFRSTSAAAGQPAGQTVFDYLNVMWTKSSDPTDLVNGWCRVRFSTDDLGADRYYFDDYPKLGDTSSSVVIGANIFEHDKTDGRAYGGGANRPFRGSRIWTLPKPANGVTTCPAVEGAVAATALGAPAGTRAGMLDDADGDPIFTPVPANTFDDSASGSVISSDSGANDAGALVARVDLNVFPVPASGPVPDTPAEVSLAGAPIPTFASPPKAPQAAPATGELDTIDARLTNAVATRDPSNGNARSIWTQHPVFDGGDASVQFYEVNVQAAAPSLTISGIVDGAPGVDVYNAAISPTRAGSAAAIEFNVSSAAAAPLIRARAITKTGAGSFNLEPSVDLATSDAPSGSPNVCGTGAAACRWGDYSGASPDPANANVVYGSSQVQRALRGSDWRSENFAISFNRSPIAVISAPDSTPTGTPVTYSGSASSDPDPGGSVVAYEWDLDGNGTFETNTGGPTAVASYPAPGVVSVGLRVTDSSGDSDATMRPVTVTNRAPGVSLSATPAATAVNRPVALTAAASDPDGSVAGFAFDLNGDNVFGLNTGATPTTTTRFTSAGSKVVRVRATDDRGAAGVGQATVLVRAFAMTGSVPSKQKLEAVRKKGLRAVATCPDGCKLRADLVLDGKSAKKLKINKKGKATVIGSATATLVAGRATTLAVKPSKKLGKRLKQIKGLKLTVKLSASDIFANRDAETLGVKLKPRSKRR